MSLYLQLQCLYWEGYTVTFLTEYTLSASGFPGKYASSCEIICVRTEWKLLYMTNLVRTLVSRINVHECLFFFNGGRDGWHQSGLDQANCQSFRELAFVSHDKLEFISLTLIVDGLHHG